MIAASHNEAELLTAASLNLLLFIWLFFSQQNMKLFQIPKSTLDKWFIQSGDGKQKLEHEP